jgi:hypothetical protein
MVLRMAGVRPGDGSDHGIQRGNRAANGLYEASVPIWVKRPRALVRQNQLLGVTEPKYLREEWIRAKYATKAFRAAEEGVGQRLPYEEWCDIQSGGMDGAPGNGGGSTGK